MLTDSIHAPQSLLSRLCLPMCAIALSAAAVTGCGSSSGGTKSTSAQAVSTSPTSAAAGVATIAARSTKLGTVLVNAAGQTLYLFEPDKVSTSTCYGSCASIWPPLTTTGRPAAKAGIKGSLLGTTKRKDGTTQVTYDGHPLYRYVGDGSPGTTTGEGLDQSGGLWYVLSPSGSAVK